MPKNKVAEVWNLPQSKRKITASNNLHYLYINFSTYVDVSGNVIQNMLMTNFDLELEEWEERQQREIQQMSPSKYVEPCKRQPSFCKVKSSMECCTVRKDETFFRMTIRRLK